jgi:hypothetical protein
VYVEVRAVAQVAEELAHMAGILHLQHLAEHTHHPEDFGVAALGVIGQGLLMYMVAREVTV